MTARRLTAPLFEPCATTAHGVGAADGLELTYEQNTRKGHAIVRGPSSLDPSGFVDGGLPAWTVMMSKPSQETDPSVEHDAPRRKVASSGHSDSVDPENEGPAQVLQRELPPQSETRANGWPASP